MAVQSAQQVEVIERFAWMPNQVKGILVTPFTTAPNLLQQPSYQPVCPTLCPAIRHPCDAGPHHADTPQAPLLGDYC